MVRLLRERVSRGRVLDVGCGDGTLAVQLRGPGYDVHCTDFGGGHPGHEGLRHVKADLRDGLPYATGSIDGIVCSEVLEHLLEPARAIAEFSRVLAPGGVLVVSVPNYWNLHHRFRYFWTGSLQRCYCKTVELGAVREDLCLPHLNTSTFETYSFVLRWHRLAVEAVAGVNPGPFWHAFPYRLLGLFVRFFGLFRDPSRAGAHGEVNGWSVLLGRHVCVVSRKVAAPAATGASAALPAAATSTTP
jgi:SAM-dependent methyltransferase